MDVPHAVILPAVVRTLRPREQVDLVVPEVALVDSDQVSRLTRNRYVVVRKDAPPNHGPVNRVVEDQCHPISVELVVRELCPGVVQIPFEPSRCLLDRDQAERAGLGRLGRLSQVDPAPVLLTRIAGEDYSLLRRADGAQCPIDNKG